MTEIAQKEIVVDAREGARQDKRSAVLLVCTKCQGETFKIFFLKGQDHPHLQCVGCDETYCQGGC